MISFSVAQRATEYVRSGQGQLLMDLLSSLGLQEGERERQGGEEYWNRDGVVGRRYRQQAMQLLGFLKTSMGG